MFKHLSPYKRHVDLAKLARSQHEFLKPLADMTTEIFCIVEEFDIQVNKRFSVKVGMPIVNGCLSDRFLCSLSIKLTK